MRNMIEKRTDDSKINEKRSGSKRSLLRAVRVLFTAVILLAAILSAGCSSKEKANRIVGEWKPSDMRITQGDLVLSVSGMCTEEELKEVLESSGIQISFMEDNTVLMNRDSENYPGTWESADDPDSKQSGRYVISFPDGQFDAYFSEDNNDELCINIDGIIMVMTRVE
ncbi:MAG: hypothetical protein PUC98_07635 [Clostridiales bacterium]|nr:hypothetical protein [Clostridiales bacterium]